MIKVQFSNLTQEKNCASAPNVWPVCHSLIAGIVNMKVENHHCHKFMSLEPKFRWIHQKCQENGFSFQSPASSQCNSSDNQSSACQWWLFIHHETSTGSTLWSPGQQHWQLSPQSAGSSFKLLWAWPCPAIEANIGHQTKQFMTRSNFDLGPPEMPLPSENEKI